MEKSQIVEQVVRGIPAAEIAAGCKVSLATVYRVIASTPSGRSPRQNSKSKARLDEARQTWERVLGKNPLSTVTQLRQSHLADWSYLYRHDRHWLDYHSPRRPGQPEKQKQALPQSLLAIASKAVAGGWEECGIVTEAPVRRSAYRLRAMTGLSEYTLSRFRSLGTGRQDSLEPETQLSFVMRRLLWVSQTSPTTGQMQTWRWAKSAGLRVSSIASVVDSHPVITNVKGLVQEQCQQFQIPQAFFYSNQQYSQGNTSPDISRASLFSLPTKVSK